jgi:hypothetical protein
MIDIILMLIGSNLSNIVPGPEYSVTPVAELAMFAGTVAHPNLSQTTHRMIEAEQVVPETHRRISAIRGDEPWPK